MTNEEDVKTRDLMLEFEQIEGLILKIVTNSTGIKTVDLVLKVIAAWMPKEFRVEEYEKILASLVECGKIIELKYTVPQMDYRVKSIYFPKGTEFIPH